MRRIFSIPLFLFLLTFCLVSFSKGEEITVLRPQATDEALINPGMGWTFFHYSNRLWAYGSLQGPGDTLDWFPGCSTIYFRIPWCYLEPEEGKFRWDLIDSRARSWIEKGKKIAFRITASENRFVYATPKWVKDAGAQGVFYRFPFDRYAKMLPQTSKDASGKTVITYPKTPEAKDLWDPKFDDPVFLAKLDKFLAAMAKRYNGNPDVAFIDIGSFGLWGEGHTGFSSKLDKKETERIVKIHMDLYKKHFPDTLLCVSDDVVSSNARNDAFPATDYAFSKGITLRDDSILVDKAPGQWYHDKMAQKFWPVLPVIIEHEHFDLSSGRGAWDQDLLCRSVEEYHASYISIHGFPEPFFKANRGAIDRINKRLGYRLELREVRYPARIKQDTPFTVETAWSNVAVAPCLPGGYITYTLKDAQSNIVWSITDESFNVRSLPVAEPGKAKVIRVKSKVQAGIVTPIPIMNDGVIIQLKLDGKYSPFDKNVPTIKPGKYDLFISIGQQDGKPVIALPLKEDDGHRRYRLGKITVDVPEV